jgi:hypothetical protein
MMHLHPDELRMIANLLSVAVIVGGLIKIAGMLVR